MIKGLVESNKDQQEVLNRTEYMEMNMVTKEMNLRK
jgi:hypothetical protein